MSRTLAEILQESLNTVAPPASYYAIERNLERDPDRPTPTLPKVRESPENIEGVAIKRVHVRPTPSAG